MEMVEYHLHPEKPFRFRPSYLLTLQRIALDGISRYAGNFRPAGIAIKGSKHQPVGAHQVPEEVEDLCDYVNNHWETATAIHLAAYVLWKLNWIHPFTDGNGRTSRAASYLVLCLKTGYPLPGHVTIPELIAENKTPYYDALEAADEKWRSQVIDLGQMEELLSTLLARQLMGIFAAATGKTAGTATESPGTRAAPAPTTGSA